MSQYENHPIANIFPMMGEKDLKALADDIAINGVIQPGTLFQGKILDGRNRYAASIIAGVDMPFCDCSESDQEDQDKFDPYAFVLSENLHRRQLQQSQRALIAAKMANLKHGGDRKSADIKTSNEGLTSVDDAASLLNVSVATVERAKHVLTNGSAVLIEAVESMQVTVSLADKLCKACKDKREQTALVKEGKKAIKEFLNPTPHRSATDRDDDGEDHDYDYPIVKAFELADYRLNTIRRLIESLTPGEKKELGISTKKQRLDVAT
jgi:ParB-like chromosome segregation protein Spo0J